MRTDYGLWPSHQGQRIFSHNVGMNETYLQMFVERMGVWGVEFASGLTDEEVAQVENTFGFRFPPDLRMFIQYALPMSKGWVNWRNENRSIIQSVFDWPAEGICFDVEHNDFWMEAWGPRPDDLSDAFSIVRQQIAAAPRLIPVCGHRYLPEKPFLAGNPVFSIYQTDIIHYGFDLASYFANAFRADPLTLPHYHVPCPDWAAQSPRAIRFWDDLIACNM